MSQSGSDVKGKAAKRCDAPLTSDPYRERFISTPPGKGMAGPFITDGMYRSWGMASYVNAGVFLDHGVYNNVSFLGNGNHYGNQRHPIMSIGGNGGDQQVLISNR